MSSNSPNPIGRPLPPSVTAKQVDQFLKSETFAAAHPELENGVTRYLEKQELRQGNQQLRNTNDDYEDL